ncbi:unnamed protein product [Arabidopsis lyrata]|uniref:Expressed protein n=1 Tax=Arabidopsis lyrata subsp. lyrata TaxID=81972 RepID=D7MJE9_ARALL|nr:expressed protein [Arabidopsis lyrata subsp. lyrata]CAH8277587.1 unnamed protein product [Arabidopsis lyrata]
MNNDEEKDNKDENWKLFYDIATKVLAMIGAIGTLANLVSLMSLGSQGKMLKISWMDARIPIKAYEDYFKDLRDKK